MSRLRNENPYIYDENTFAGRLMFLLVESRYCKRKNGELQPDVPEYTRYLANAGYLDLENLDIEHAMQQIKSQERVINKHLQISEFGAISSSAILLYAKSLNCSADYLLGLIDRPRYDD